MASPNERIFKKLKQDMDRIMTIRIGNGLMKPREAKMPKVTELLTRTEGYQKSLEELKFKPERKKNGK